MRIAILCPGPSLAGVLAIPESDRVIAVNHAMNHPLAKHAHWWCALDLWHPLPLPLHAPRIGMVTSQAAIDEGQSHHIPYPLFDFLGHPRARRTATTLPAALWWAAYRALGRPLDVHLYGCDMRGDSDFAGTTIGIRTDERWAREYAECLAVIEATGMSIEGLPDRGNEHPVV